MKTPKNTKLFLTACALFLSVFANAQLRFGPALGLNLANISGDGDSTNAMKIGFHIGGIVEISISDNFIVAPGVLFTLKGTQDKNESKYKSNLSYIEIPINAKYKTESGFNVFAGPYIGLLMSAKATDGTNDTDIKDFLKSSDFGLNVGLGFDMESGFGISAQYGLGLSNINDVSGGGSFKNNVIGITVKYMLGGK